MKDTISDYIKKVKEEGIFISVKNNDLDVKAPKGKMTREIMEELKKRKPELLSYLAGVSLEKSAIEPVENATGNYPISNAQRRLWVLSQFESGSLAYHLPGTIFLNRGINIGHFTNAIDATIDRHEILRTVFKENEAGEVRQWVLKKEELGFKIDYRDLRKEPEKEKKIQAFMAEDANKVFDLVNGPLLRASLLQVEDEGYVFYHNMHHIISDGWSMDVLAKDVLAYYEAYGENREPALKPLKIHYKDYSAWQLAKLEEESFKSHRAYWLESLKGDLPLLDLPRSKQRPAIKTYNGYGLSAYLDASTTAKIHGYLRENGGSLFMFLLASWNVLVYRYTSQTDIITGTPVANREHAGLEDQIGFYINTLALRNKLDPGKSFNDLYRSVRDNTLESYNHQIYPFDKLVEELDHKADPARSVLFDVLLVLQNKDERTANSTLTKDEQNRIMDLGYSTCTFEIRLVFQEIGDHLALTLTYNPDVYDGDFAEALITHYKQLLGALLEDPGASISHIDYLSGSEKEELLSISGTAKVGYPKELTIVDLFERQVAEGADRIAVSNGDKKLSYGELHERSDRLARHLRYNYHIGAGDLVGIQLQRSEWLIVTILGILKAGGAYVPIDPEYPASRKEHIVKDASINLLVTEEGFIHEVDYHTGALCVIDTEFETLPTGSEAWEVARHPHNIAYVIYTSGSTGKPKGVMVEHYNVVRLFINDARLYDFTSKDVWTMFHSYAFDFSVWEMYGALFFGGRLVLVPKPVAQDSGSYLDLLEKEGVTILNQTPSAFYSLSKELESSQAELKVRCVIFGGEALSPGRLQSWKNRYPDCKLINMYGITETTVHTTYKEISQEDIRLNRSNIGKAIPTVSCIVLDENKNLVPVGVAGELYVGGAGVARGYLNREELTKERFIAHPYIKGERLYRSGDKVKLLRNGDLEYLGRIDHQVKIRGYRIELGEIEQALLKHDQMEEVVVIARENRSGEKALVAYIKAKTPQTTNELRSWLKHLLPEYMLPSSFIQLAEMPLTGNGKIDRKALPDPEGLEAESGAEYVAPRNEIEEKLVVIWEEVLKRKDIGVKDDFFALGGHSLKIIKVINQVNKHFGLRYDLRGAYTEPTIESMARKIKTDTWFMGSTIENENDYNEIKI